MLVPVVLVIAMVIRKVPAFPALLIGALVGGASLKAADFGAIISALSAA